LIIAMATCFPREPEAPAGGVEAVSVNLVDALSEVEDLTIHVVTLDPEVSAAETVLFKKALIHRLPIPKGSVLLSAVTSGRRALSGFLKYLKPDVVHAHDTYGLMVKGLPFPRVFTIHGFIHADTRISNEKFPKLRSTLWRKFETAGWADQPHVIAISPYVREAVSKIVRGTIHDIENPVTRSYFEVTHHEKRGTIFSAAAISPRKNTALLLDAFEILIKKGYDFQLRLAGTVLEKDYGLLIDQKTRKKVFNGRVHLLGGISRKQIQAELAQAAVFALVSLEENAPLGIAEAMAAGVPVVASNRCGMPYMVRHGESGFLVAPLDPMDIASRLEQLLNDDGLRKTMGDNSKAFAQRHFHPASVARRTHAVYLEASHRGLGGLTRH
jgi:glycosyltransferase involved in cell wall biosynthesis